MNFWEKSIFIYQLSALCAKFSIIMVGDEGFEPPNSGVKVRCLTTWRIPNNAGSKEHKTGYSYSALYF